MIEDETGAPLEIQTLSAGRRRALGAPKARPAGAGAGRRGLESDGEGVRRGEAPGLK